VRKEKGEKRKEERDIKERRKGKKKRY